MLAPPPWANSKSSPWECGAVRKTKSWRRPLTMTHKSACWGWHIPSSSCSSYPGPCSAWGCCTKLLGVGGCTLQVSEEPASRPGLCGTVCLFLRMIEHLYPSVVHGLSSLPASLASAYPSPAALDQPIHHADWFLPINFPTPLVIQTCLEL